VSEHPRLLDLRHEQTEVNRRDACEYRRGAVVMRDPKAVTGVTLHQTACWYGVSPGQLKASDGDEILARHRRALKVNAHVTAMRHGSFVLAYDLLTYVWHGDLLNATDVGLEEEGLYDADGAPINKPASVKIGDIIDASRAALTYMAEELPALRWVHAHRQSRRAPKAAKTSCCSALFFREVGVEHGVRKLGLRIEPDRTWGTGKPLPRNWYA
jgi:hypothetical protein